MKTEERFIFHVGFDAHKPTPTNNTTTLTLIVRPHLRKYKTRVYLQNIYFRLEISLYKVSTKSIESNQINYWALKKTGIVEWQ